MNPFLTVHDVLYVQELFFELVTIDSPSKNEQDIAARCARKLAAFGFDVLEDNAGDIIGGTSGNLIATKQGNPVLTPVLLTAHMDSVPPCLGIIPVQGDDGWVRSQGETVLGADDKAGIAAIFAALNILQNSKSLPTIQVVLTVAEELGLQGSKNISPEHLVARHGLAIDSGGSPGTLVVGGPTLAKWQATVTGRRAHAGVSPETGISAIKVAAEAVAKMPHGRVDDKTTVNVGSFLGDGPTNVVADKAQLIGEARSHDEERLAEVLEEVKRAFEQVAKAKGATVDFDASVSYHGYTFDEQHPIRQRVENAIRFAGLKPRPVMRGGGSDANIFTSMGIPTVNLGVGYEDIHSPSERVRMKDIASVANIIAAFCRYQAE